MWVTLVGAVKVHVSVPFALWIGAVGPDQPSTVTKFDWQVSPPPVVLESATSNEKVVTGPVALVTEQSADSNPAPLT